MTEHPLTYSGDPNRPSGMPSSPPGAIVPFPYLAGLNPQQRAAVEAVDGPVLVLAGAGTGKTRVLTTRLAHLMVTGRARPHQILAVTFTNKAAREMAGRITQLVGGMGDGVWLGTFHALAARMLRQHAELAGLGPRFTILDADDQLRLLKQVMEAEGVDEKRWPPRILASVIERWKDRGLTPDRVTAAEASDFAAGRALDLYRLYQERLRTLNACDFGDLLLHLLTVFQAHPDVLARWHRQLRYILVDEYQDTNVAQYLWLRLLAQGSGNLCCVGDEDQSIYGWRGAEVGNILRFEAHFPGAQVIRLEQNYRSTGHILAAASAVIAHNQDRLGKTLWTADGAGAPVAVRGVWDGPEEARVVGEEIETLQRAGCGLGSMAILVRASFQTREFEERFLTLGLAYRVVGGLRFYERQEIRDAIAYLRLVASPGDDLAFERIVNKPRRGVGDTTVRALQIHARQHGVGLLESAARLAEGSAVKGPARRGLKAIAADVARWRGLVDTLGPAELARVVLDESGYTGMWQTDPAPEAPGRLDNLKELVEALAEFDTLAGFLEHVALVNDTQEQAGVESVTLMTLHAAKGLEFDTVFLPGWEEGVFPHARALAENGQTGLEEERRLAYVGLTRARHRALISFAANRRVHGSWQSALPSRFVAELPAGHVAMHSDAGLYGNASLGHRGGIGGGMSGGMGAGSGSTLFGSPPPLPGAGSSDETRARLDAPPRMAGWTQAGARGAMGLGSPPTIEGRAVRLQAGGTPPPAVGTRVFHDKFGYGQVTAAEGDKLTIAFDHSGEKRVMADFVRAA